MMLMPSTGCCMKVSKSFQACSYSNWQLECVISRTSSLKIFMLLRIKIIDGMEYQSHPMAFMAGLYYGNVYILEKKISFVHSTIDTGIGWSDIDKKHCSSNSAKEQQELYSAKTCHGDVFAANGYFTAVHCLPISTCHR